MALNSAKKSRAQKPSDLSHPYDNLSELLTCIFFCRLVELQSLSLCNYLFSYLTHCTYFSNLNSKLLLVNAKKMFRLAFRHVSISLHFLFTVEECWSKGTGE